jgi:hypothetical protein
MLPQDEIREKAGGILYASPAWECPQQPQAMTGLSDKLLLSKRGTKASASQ